MAVHCMTFTMVITTEWKQGGDAVHTGLKVGATCIMYGCGRYDVHNDKHHHDDH
jgi:hypothetical protein